MSIKEFIKNNHSFVFISINILVAFLGFVRSFAFMKFFDFKDLGLITIVSTAASLIGFFQIGLINGGYRIIALRESDSNIKVNNVIFSYFGVLSVFLVGFGIVAFSFGIISDWLISLLIITIGVLSLVTNWISNILIGAGEFNKLNQANLISATASLLSLILGFYFGLYGALFSLLIQPLIFIGVVFYTSQKYIPNKFDMDLKQIKYILSFGFVPFLSGIFFLLYQQIERWSINFFLGPEALGKMYLVFLITTLWLLIPNSINSLFFPKAVKLYVDGNIHHLKSTINQYYIIIIIYCLIASILIFFILPPIVYFFFPKHYAYINLVYIILPGITLRNLCDPISLFLNSIVKLNPILWSDITSTFIYGFMLLFLDFMKIFSLENVLICYVLYNFIKFIYLFINFILIRKQL